MAEERATLQPVKGGGQPLPGGGLVGAVGRATYKIGALLEAVQTWATETEKALHSTIETAGKAKAATDAAAIGASHEKSTSSDSALTTPGGRTPASTGAALGSVATALTQSEGRLT